MGFVDKDDKKKAKKGSKTVNTPFTQPYIVPNAEQWNQRNSWRVNPELNFSETEANLLKLLQNAETSTINEGQNNNQQEVIQKIYVAFKKKSFRTALAILFSEDLQMTPQLEEIALRLIRLDEIERQRTTDVKDFDYAKGSLKNLEGELVKHSSEDDKESAVLAVENVVNGESGTTETGLKELETVKFMVKQALRASLKEKYQGVLPPHKMYGQQEPGNKDQNYIQSDASADITEYLRLYEILSIEILEKRQNTKEKEDKLLRERGFALEGLEHLAGFNGVNLDIDKKQKFLEKISVMNMGQVSYFLGKVESLKDRLKRGSIKPEQAEQEINNWLAKNFTSEELKQELSDLKEKDGAEDQAQMEMIRKRIAA